MSDVIDARGLACPLPVVKAKQAWDRHPDELIVLVDDAAARENVIRFAENAGARVNVTAEEKDFKLTLHRQEKNS